MKKKRHMPESLWCGPIKISSVEHEFGQEAEAEISTYSGYSLSRPEARQLCDWLTRWLDAVEEAPDE